MTEFSFTILEKQILYIFSTFSELTTSNKFILKVIFFHRIKKNDVLSILYLEVPQKLRKIALQNKF